MFFTKFRPMSTHELHGLFISSQCSPVSYFLSERNRKTKIVLINQYPYIPYLGLKGKILPGQNKSASLCIFLLKSGSDLRIAKYFFFTKITQTFLDMNPMASLNTKGSNDRDLAFEVIFLAQPKNLNPGNVSESLGQLFLTGCLKCETHPAQ